MSTAHFDTHSFVKRLKAAGFTEEQAEAQVQALMDLVYDQLATKRDLKELELRLTLRLGTMMAVAIGIVAALVRLL